MNETVQPHPSFRFSLRLLACLAFAFGLAVQEAQAWLGHGLYFTGSSQFPNSWGGWQDLNPSNTYSGLAGTGRTSDSTSTSGGLSTTRQSFEIRNDTTDVISFAIAVYSGNAWGGAGSVTLQPGMTTWVSGDTYRSDGLTLEQYAAYGWSRTAPTPTTYMLTTRTGGQGTGTISPGSGQYNAGTSVTITATPTNRSTFNYFDVDGRIDGSNPLVVQINGPKSVTAYFNPPGTDNHAPTVSLSGPTAAVATGTSFTLSASATDPDSNLASVAITKNGGGIIASSTSPNNPSHSVSGTDTAGAAGSSVTYTATARDTEGLTATSTLTVSFVGAEDVTASISASPSSVDAPGSSTISWTSTNASSVTVSGEGLSSTSTSGSQIVSNLSSGTYTYTITAEGPGGPVTRTATVSVSGATAPAPNVTASISATAYSNAEPGTGSISWNSSNATAVSVTFDGGAVSTASSGSQYVSGLAGGTHTATITAQGNGGPVTKSASLVITAAAPRRHMAGGPNPSTLSWKGGLIQIVGDCDIYGSGKLSIRKLVPVTTTVDEVIDYTEDGEPIYGPVSHMTYDKVVVAEISCSLPKGTGVTFGGAVWSAPAATDQNPVYYETWVEGTDGQGGSCGGSLTVSGQPLPLAQTISVTPTDKSAAPGDVVQFTASGAASGKYDWQAYLPGVAACLTVNAATNVAQFRVPADAKPGDSWIIDVSSPASGEYTVAGGVAYERSNVVRVTVHYGSFVQTPAYTLLLVATPNRLPSTGGSVTVVATKTIAPTYTGPVDPKNFETFVQDQTSLRTTLGYGGGTYTYIVPPNFSGSEAKATFGFNGFLPGFAASSVKQDVLIAAPTAGERPLIRVTPTSTLIDCIEGLSFQMAFATTVYSLGSPATTSVAIIAPDGSIKAPSHNLPAYVSAGVASSGSGSWVSASAPPMGTYTIRVEATNAVGTTVATAAVQVFKRITVYGRLAALAYVESGETDENGDPISISPGDMGWGVTPSYDVIVPGTPRTFSVIQGDPAFRLVRWYDNSGKTLSRGLSVTPTPTINNSVYYAEVTTAAHLVPVEFIITPTFVYDGTEKCPVTTNPEGVPYVTTSGTSKATNAGNYTATVAADAMSAYQGTKTFNWSITRKPVNFEFTDLTQPYDGTPKAATITPSAPAATYTVVYVGGNGTTYVGSSTPPTEPGRYTVSATATGNYSGRNEAQLTIVKSNTVISFTPIESSWVVNDTASPMNGKSYKRVWREGGGWAAYLGRDGVKFEVKADAYPAIQMLELQAKAPGREWARLSAKSPDAAVSSATVQFAVMLDSVAPENPLMPVSYKAGAPLTGRWTFRARVQDTRGGWSEFSPDVPVEVVLPVTTKVVSGQTIPPAGELGNWFTPSTTQSFTFPLWIP